MSFNNLCLIRRCQCYLKNVSAKCSRQCSLSGTATLEEWAPDPAVVEFVETTTASSGSTTSTCADSASKRTQGTSDSRSSTKRAASSQSKSKVEPWTSFLLLDVNLLSVVKNHVQQIMPFCFLAYLRLPEDMKEKLLYFVSFERRFCFQNACWSASFNPFSIFKVPRPSNEFSVTILRWNWSLLQLFGVIF